MTGSVMACTFGSQTQYAGWSSLENPLPVAKRDSRTPLSLGRSSTLAFVWISPQLAAWNVRIAYDSLTKVVRKAGGSLPKNSEDRLRRNLVRAVIEHLHTICAQNNLPPIDSVRGIFTEGTVILSRSGILRKDSRTDRSLQPQVHQGILSSTCRSARTEVRF